MNPAIARGADLFNRRRFFEAHEAWEEQWLAERGDAKLALHGLIQIAAAFYHYSRANLQGFRSLLKKGAEKLDRCPDETCGIDWESLRAQLRAWREFGSAGGSDCRAAPPLPRITIRPAGPPG